MNLNIFGNLKLNQWYGVVFFVGVLMIGASLFFSVTFLQQKHVFGFGLGLIMIGISMFMSERVETQFFATGILSVPIHKHNIATILILLIGIGLAVVFGFFIVKGLF
jgi:hypothetical protein